MTAYVPAPVPCAGCGALVAYEVGDDGCHGEVLKTPIGLVFRRTCRVRSCVEASRAAVDGVKTEWPVRKADAAMRDAARGPAAATS